MATNSKKQAEVHTESTHIRARLAGDPEDDKVALLVILEHLALVDGADAELALHSRDERWPLEECTSEGLDGACHRCLATLRRAVKARNANVLLTRALLAKK